MNQYYKTVIEVTVLTSEPYVPDDLHEVACAINDELCGRMSVGVSQAIPREEMIRFLRQEGCEPSFFMDDWTEADEEDGCST
jgi:hypothetical protein